MRAAPPGEGATRIADVPELKNHFGTVHGGALYTLGEVASASAVLSALGERAAGLRVVTRGARIRYVKPARGAIDAHASLNMRLLEEALVRVEQHGRADVQVTVVLTDAHDLQVADLAVEWFIGRRLDSPDERR
jgi:acyl-coenzyme A thioesterase PaaI-like protein